MGADRILVADGRLQQLFGHQISVAGQLLELGHDGLCAAPHEAAEILLRQEGWSEMPADEPDDAPKGGRKKANG